MFLLKIVSLAAVIPVGPCFILYKDNLVDNSPRSGKLVIIHKTIPSVQHNYYFRNPLSITFDFRIITGCFHKAEMTYQNDNNPTETLSRSRGNFREHGSRILASPQENTGNFK